MEAIFDTEKSETEKKRIVSCVSTIIQTPKGTVPYARDMGLDRLYPRDNSAMAENEYSSELIDAIDEWEERVIADEVVISSDHIAKVVLKDAGT